MRPTSLLAALATGLLVAGTAAAQQGKRKEEPWMPLEVGAWWNYDSSLGTGSASTS